MLDPKGRRFRFVTVVESLESRRLLADATASLLDTIHASTDLTLMPTATGSTIAGLTPAQVAKAYGYNQISFSGVVGSGAGQTIAIVGAYDAPTILSDLKTFDKQFGLSDPSFKKESQTGSTTSLPSADAGWALELSLDVEWAHAVAPKANILLVEAKSDSLGDLMSAVDTARNAAGVSVVSMSWGAGEFWGETSLDSHFTTPAGHQGVTFVAASGDDGSFFGPEWPAVSPGVLSVGGTSLSLTSSGTYSSERGWSDSGGGFSQLENEPSYQSTVQDTGVRTSPDVSYDANPNTGFAVYDSTSYEGFKGWGEVGGTSAGTPQWAALVAIADQGRVLAGKTTLNGLTQTLPTLYSTASNSSTYTADFHDITSGRTSYFISAFGGYDLVTGLGSPKAAAIAQLLKNAGSTVTSSVKTAASTATTKVTKAARAVATLADNVSPVLLVADQPAALQVDHSAIVSAAEVHAGTAKESTVLSFTGEVGTGQQTTDAHFGERSIATSSLGGGAAALAPMRSGDDASTASVEVVEVALPPEMFEGDARAALPSTGHNADDLSPRPHMVTASMNLAGVEEVRSASKAGMLAFATAAGAILVAQWQRMRKRGVSVAASHWDQNDLH